MAFILISFEGQKTFGGFMSIDGGYQFPLSDGQLIKVDSGMHYLKFSSISKLSRGLNNLNAYVGNYNTAAWGERNAVDGTISEGFNDNSVMVLHVVSDARGHVLDLPQYVLKDLDPEDYAKCEEEYQQHLEEIKEEEKKTEIAQQEELANENLTVELLLCLFLGGIGAHKFYVKKYGMGVLYLFTGGLFLIGALVDLFVIIGKMSKKNKTQN